ncbi:MAG: YdeI/OmpD-associated family protein [Candidatus Wallbacteria bacterium]|nr:YdeI/OmpD-associated family protein [Candidatus Wallbacteria bacterium]
MKTFYAKDRQDWRNWLSENHDSCKEVWLIYYKAHTGKPRVPYDDAVEEAICFGWIDSIIRKLDEQRFCQKFTPRKPGSLWSKPNLKRADMMISQEKMTQKGLELYRIAVEKGQFVAEKEEQLSVDLITLFKANREAYSRFCNLPGNRTSNYIGWIMSAKGHETRIRRLNRLIGAILNGEDLIRKL